MVIGGKDGSQLDVVEVIDLDDPDKSCEPAANYPTATQDVTVKLVDGVVKACGGLSTGLAMIAVTIYMYILFFLKKK